MMRRCALLIGYSGKTSNVDSTLGGVLSDLENYKKYLKSYRGGAWLDSEIKTLEDADLNTIQDYIAQVKDNYDLVFTVYSGHGEYDKISNCRILGTADSKEFSENIFTGLAKKQISIFDSCSGIRNPIIISESLEKKAYTKDSLKKEKAETARMLYELYCTMCPEQELRYYASSIGGYAYDNKDGGIYSKTLLETLNKATTKLNINDAHDETCILIKNKTNNKQIPDKFIPRVNKFLPGAIII